MSFWANKLGVVPQAAPQAPAPQQDPGQAPWWRPSTPQPQQQQYQQPQQFQQQQAYAPPMDAEAQAVARAASKARSARESEFCPECGGGDYFRANQRAVKRCYECGYTDSGRTWQSGSGDTSMTIQGTGAASKQLPSGHSVMGLPSGFNGKFVVDSIAN